MPIWKQESYNQRRWTVAPVSGTLFGIQTIARCSRLLVLLAATIISRGAFATSFIVPSDHEMVAKSSAIVIGTVESSWVRSTGSMIDTVYALQVERALKGSPAPGNVLDVVSPGGFIGDIGVEVPGAPRFQQGERVLLFLLRESDGWQVTDLTLGKFRFVMSTAGETLLARDPADDWIDLGSPSARGSQRRAQDFIQFIEKSVSGHLATTDYLVNAQIASADMRTMATERIEAMAPFPADTYVNRPTGGPQPPPPARWTDASMAAGILFHKKDNQDAVGLPDGGVSVIQNGLAAWTDECGSAINITYGGTTSTPATNFDSVHVVEFNDPQGRVGGTWTGSGTVAITFISFAGTQTFEGNPDWLIITDADVVFQDGYAGTQPSMPTAMTHELGHGIGWRHSNAHHTRDPVTFQDLACIPAIEECTTNAIMHAVANAALGYTLQTWDINAAQSVYPGSCVPLAQRTFVSAATGSDANNCSRLAPCRQFAAAMSNTASGGEVIVLDSGGYGTVTINKPISIISAAGVYAGITAFSGNAITVSAGPSDRIALRGLTLQGLGGAIGVDFTGGKALLVENCLVNGFSQVGLRMTLTVAGQLFVTDTIVRNGALDGISVQTSSGLATATLDHVVIENNGPSPASGRGLLAGDRSRVNVQRSISSGNGIQFMASTAGPGAVLNIDRCLAFGNGTGTGIQVATATIRVSNSTITNNATGIVGATITSRQNNTLEGNAAGNTFPLTYAPK